MYLDMGDALKFDLQKRRSTDAIREAARDRLEKIYPHRSIFEAMFHSDFMHEEVVYEVVQFDAINELFWRDFAGALAASDYSLKPVAENVFVSYLPQ